MGVMMGTECQQSWGKSEVRRHRGRARFKTHVEGWGSRIWWKGERKGCGYRKRFRNDQRREDQGWWVMGELKLWVIEGWNQGLWEKGQTQVMGLFIYFDTFFIFLVRRVTGSIKHTYLLSLFCRCLENCESRHTKIENFPSSILCCWYRIPGEMNSRHFTPSNL